MASRHRYVGVRGSTPGSRRWTVGRRHVSGFFLDDIVYTLSSAARAARLEQPRFLRSHETEPFQIQPAPVGDFDLVFRNCAFLYDNALALLAFLAEESSDGLRRARLIGDAFVYAAEHDRAFSDGRPRDAYAAGDIALPPGWTPNGRAGTVPIPGYFVETSQESTLRCDAIRLGE